ncbi:MAG: methionine adenosyltransferase [Fastidiosipilaceae bacterium]|nr:methionine adenosyltransferase [Clostridiaceae bacterium]
MNNNKIKIKLPQGHYLFSSESVTEGHPDKVCDQISDAVLDEILSRDSTARVACETVVTTGMVLVMGEITTTCYVDIPAIVRGVIEEVGYTKELGCGFNANSCAVLTAIDEQSPDISQGVTDAIETRDLNGDQSTGAGDQGMMFGYACNETEERMPLTISLAHRLCKRLADVRKDGTLPLLRPDGKAQVTAQYNERNEVVRVTDIVVSTQHAPEYDQADLRRDIIREVITPVFSADLIDDETRIYVNPTGRFVVGGPEGDSGLSGRKIIVDTYGGWGAHGGGSFSGKDPTKVDRSASYMSRYIAKNIVAAGLADRCEIQLAYSIGVAHPLSVMVDTHGTSDIPEEILVEAVQMVFDLTPDGIISTLDLRRPIYRQVASYGHFGRTDVDVPWEKENRINELQAAVKQLNK